MDDQKKILIVDDVEANRFVLRNIISEMGHLPVLAENGVQSLKIMEKIKPNLILLDVAMPEMDGYELCRILKDDPVTRKIPIIFISAKSQSIDKIIGLNAGADDYITKPFEPLELIARVKSNIRRYTKLGNLIENDNIIIDGLEINDKTKEVMVDGEKIKLTSIEYKLLLFLASNKGQVFSIKQIYENVWKEPFDGYEKKVVVHISHIRDKIEINPKEPKYLKAVWGLGYKIENI